MPFPHKKICVIGSTGSGKTTLARTIANTIGSSYIELDALYHLPGWQDASREEFHAMAMERMSAERWVVDGNYMNMLWDHLAHSDLIIWLDYPFRIVLRRMLWRTFKRLLTKEELWNGNRETWKMTFSRESIILFLFQTYWKRRRDFPRYLSRYEAQLLRFRHPRETREWLKGL